MQDKKIQERERKSISALKRAFPYNPHSISVLVLQALNKSKHYKNRPLAVAEIKAHPEYPHTIWDLKPEAKGKLAVAKGRGGPINVAWEVHGRGEDKIVVRRTTVVVHPSN